MNFTLALLQLKPGTSLPSSFSLPGGFVDTTKLAGQLSVVQELPEVSRLVFQEVKQEEGQDSIVNILETMKQEEPGSLSPLDYTVSSTSEAPLNLVNNLAKGVKRVVGPVQSQDAKRIKNVYLVQGENGQQLIQEMPGSTGGYTYATAQRSSPSPGLAQDLVQGLPQGLCLDPPSPLGNSIKKEPKSKSNSPKLSLTKTINGTTIPSSKTCNWVFENGQVCGKTFSKSYNLVVHMRMHEDIRPFACTLCDQTFRQKAHLQRHETTHGIQTKNFYRTPSSKRKKKRNPSGEGVNNELSKNLQDRLARVNQNLNKAHREGGDSEGEEYMEDEEDDMYVPNGNPAKKAALRDLRKYSEKEQRATDGELDPEDGGGKGSPLGSADSREHLQGGTQLMAEADDDNSTVQDILQTVNSVPTLEQKLESSAYLNCDSLLLRALPTNKPIMSVSAAPSYLPVTSTSSYSTTSLPHITKLVESTSISGVSLPSSLATTCPQTLPGSCYFTSSAGATAAQTNILFTTLSAHTSTSSSPHKTLSFIETSVPASIANSYTNGNVSSHKSQHGQIVIDNIDDHSPEIQAEILNALLADESYPEQGQVEEMWEEEIFRLSTLPPTWWVSRKRRAGSSHGEVTYYSPEGYSFKSKTEIQDFLTNNVVPKEPADLRLPPLPIEQIPVIEETFVRPSSTVPMDTNSIAQALIANLKPEPIESLKDALSCEPKLRESLSLQQSASPTCSPLNC